MSLKLKKSAVRTLVVVQKKYLPFNISNLLDRKWKFFQGFWKSKEKENRN